MALSDLEVAFGGPFPGGRLFGRGERGRQGDGEQISNSHKKAETVCKVAEQLGLPGLQDDNNRATEIPRGNGAQAVSYGCPVTKAETAIRSISAVAERVFENAEKRLSLGMPEVQTALYHAIVDLEERAQLDTFLADRGVRRHGNAKNPYTTIIRAFTKGAHQRVRQALSKAAAMMALAREDGISSKEFHEWRQRWPIERACREWRNRQKGNHCRDEDEESVDFYLVSDAEFVPAVRQASGYAGRQLAVIECAQDFSGSFRLVRVLPCDAAFFRRTVLSAMHKKSVRGQRS